MVKYKDKPDSEEALLNILNPLVKKWFFSRFKEFSLPQLYGVTEIHGRNNILISAPTGATKCLTPDETVLIHNNGFTRLVSGNELIKQSKEGRLIKRIGKTGKLIEISGLNSYSLQKNEKLSTSTALIYFENANDSMLKIKTEYGKEVKISRDHPLLVEGKGWTKSKDLKIGEKIAVPKKITLPECKITLNWKDALNNLKKKAKVCITYEDYLRLKRRTRDFRELDLLEASEIKELIALSRLSYTKISRDLGIAISSVYRLIHNNSTFRRKQFEIYLCEKSRRIRFERNRIIYKTHGTHEFSFVYPKLLDARLGKWIAFILAEGIIGDYEKGTYLLVSQKKRMRLLKEFFLISKGYFDIEFKKKNENDYAVYSTLFCYFITDLFSVKRGRGRYVDFPDWTLNCSRNIKSSFLSTFFSLESTVSNRSIKITQSNKNKIEVINYILLSFGIFSSIGKEKSYATNTENKTKREYYTLTISQIPNLIKFFRCFNIEHDRIKSIVRHLHQKPSGHYVNKFEFDYKEIRGLSKYYSNDKCFKKDVGCIYEVVRRTGYITEISLKRLAEKIEKKNSGDHLLKIIRGALNNDILWLRIKKITEFHYNGVVFDLNVPNIHNFIGGFGGIILHNTLTSFLSILNELVDSAEKGILEDKIYCVYISPLNALNNDIMKNLIEPLKEIEAIAGKELGIRVSVRTGDTTASEKSSMLRKPPHILITSPESLAIVLASLKFVDHMKSVDWVVVDEIHALAENKRGVHLSLSLERLQHISKHITRIGLSATIAPIGEVAKFLVGYEDGKNDKLRDCLIVDVSFLKKMDLKVLSPVPDLINTDFKTMHDRMYELLDNLIQEHKTTLIFTNTRSATERVVHHLKERFPKNYAENIGAHHGSLSKDLRFDIEERLRQGKLKVVVSSTSLELGIDIGYIDLVILLGSPKSVARALQRIGRSGHRLHETTKGRIIVLDRDDLIECSVLLKSAIEQKIDKIHIPTNCLDVLTQHIHGIALSGVTPIEDILILIRHSYCYKNLERKDMIEIIEYLAGRFISLEDRNIYAKIWYDKEKGLIGKKGRMSRVIHMTNIGTIPDEASVIVKIGERKIGTIEEPFLEKLKKGDIFVLGGEVYEFMFSRGMVAQVRASPNRPPTVPSWFSETLPLSFDLAMDIGRLRRLLEEQLSQLSSGDTSGNQKERIIEFINSYLYVDSNSANAIYEYFKEQYDYVKEIPSDKKILVEHYTDEEGRKYAVFHTLFGRRVNDCLSRAIAFAISRTQHRDTDIGINDNGFYIGYVSKINAVSAFKILKPKDFSKVMSNAIEKTEVMNRRFRHCATRALLILRSYAGHVKRVGRQQVSSMILMNAVRRISHDFFVLKEARREVLEDLMDIENSKKILTLVDNNAIKIKEISTVIPSPFSFNIVLQGRVDVLRIEDKNEFLRRMHRNVLVKIALNQGKKLKKEETKDIDYEEIWKRAEEKRNSKEEEEKRELKMMVWNLKRVPLFAKEEMAEIIDGKDIDDVRPNFIAAVKKYRKEIEKSWPKELKEIVFKRVNIV